MLKRIKGSIKYTLLVIGLMSIISFSKNSIFENIKSEIKWKFEEEPRFKEIKELKNGEEVLKKIIPGEYVINLYELNYPTEILDKNKFYNNLNEFLSKTSKNKKYSILIDKRFYDDMKELKKDSLSEKEKILELPSSSLNEYEKQELIKLSFNMKVSQYIGTDQEYLNRQIYVLYELLNKKNFDINNVYSELDKEILLTELKNSREKIILNFENSKIEFFIKDSFDNIEFNKFHDDSVYKFDNDILISEDIQDQSILPNIKENLYLSDFPLEILKKLEKNQIKLKRRILVLENNEFHGYTYNENNIIIFVSGENPVYYYKDYKIDINLERVNIKDLFLKNSNYYVSDFFN